MENRQSNTWSFGDICICEDRDRNRRNVRRHQRCSFAVQLDVEVLKSRYDHDSTPSVHVVLIRCFWSIDDRFILATH